MQLVTVRRNRFVVTRDWSFANESGTGCGSDHHDSWSGSGATLRPTPDCAAEEEISGHLWFVSSSLRLFNIDHTLHLSLTSKLTAHSHHAYRLQYSQTMSFNFILYSFSSLTLLFYIIFLPLSNASRLTISYGLWTVGNLNGLQLAATPIHIFS